MFIGVSCACMPAFSKTLHHHLPTLEKLRSTVFSRFASFRPSEAGDTTGRSGLAHSDGPSHYPVTKTEHGPYSHLETELPALQGVTLQPNYELGHLQSVQTFIGKGWKRETSDDKIHLTHEIEQQARTQ